MRNSSQEFVLIDGKWVKRPYSHKQPAKSVKAKTYKTQLSKFERKKQQKARVAKSRPTTRARENAAPSTSEAKIAAFLAANQIHFIREYHAPNLYNPDTNHLIYFDFFIPKYNLVIEFDGLHHFKPIYGPARLAKQKRVDAIKYGYCKKHKINLLQLRCFDKEDIETIICKKFDEIDPVN